MVTRNPIDRLANLIVLAIAAFIAFCGIGGLLFTVSVLSYRLLEYAFGAA